MVKWIDNCVGCTDQGLHCMGSGCPNRGRWVECCDRCMEPLNEDGTCSECDNRKGDEDDEKI